MPLTPLDRQRPCLGAWADCRLLQVLMRSGTETEKKHAQRIAPVRGLNRKQHRS